MSKQEEVLDLSRTYIQLRDGPDAIPVPVGKDFWEKIAERTDLGEGRLVMVGGASEDWKHWEMHPVGEEVLYLLSGALDLVLCVVEATLAELESADVNHVRIIAGDRPGENPGVVLDAYLLADFGCDMGDLRKVGAKRI